MKRVILGIAFMGILSLFVGISFGSGSTCSSQAPCGDGEHFDDDCNCVPDNPGTNPNPGAGGTPSGPEQGSLCGGNPIPEGQFCCDGDLSEVDCASLATTSESLCPEDRIYNITSTQTGCCPGTVNEQGQCETELSQVGINISTDCLLRGGCSLNVYEVMGIRKSNTKPTVGGLFQDIVLAATTFVGTVIVLALIVSGLIFAFGSISGKDTKRAKTIMVDCFVGLLLVMGSYTIVRLIQFIATAGS